MDPPLDVFFIGKRRNCLVDQLERGRQVEGGREAARRHGVQEVGGLNPGKHGGTRNLVTR